MKFKASIDIMPLEALLDPQGKAVSQSMNNLGLTEINNVTLHVESKDRNSAEKVIEKACKKLLCNQIMESFNFTIDEI